MKNKKKGIFTNTEVIGTSVVTKSTKVELVQVTMCKRQEKVVVYQLMVNGDLFTSIDNRQFAFYLLNYFDFERYYKNLIDLEDDFDDLL